MLTDLSWRGRGRGSLNLLLLLFSLLSCLVRIVTMVQTASSRAVFVYSAAVKSMSIKNCIFTLIIFSCCFNLSLLPDAWPSFALISALSTQTGQHKCLIIFVKISDLTSGISTQISTLCLSVSYRPAVHDQQTQP